ncbi:MAG: glucosaminidase domain-containing protein [Bacteroidales bacterium]|nr:glucosaminidase domain-containing protein [Bacteroidales bacterium]
MKPADFLNRYAQECVDACQGTGIFPSVTIAQAIVESGWGNSTPGNNLFGIVAHNQYSPYWKGEYITANDNGNTRKFRKYATTADSIKDHTYFLQKNGRYAKALAASTPEEQARELAAAGYAESKSYADTLIKVINTHNLKQYDKKKSMLNNKYVQIIMAAVSIILAANIIYKNL